MNNFELGNLNQEVKADTEEQKAEELLKSETNINSSLLAKIKNNPMLRKAFYTIALSVGLLAGKESLSQESPNSIKEPEKIEIQNVAPEVEELDLQKIAQESSKYIQNSEYFSAHPNSLMAWAASAEKPTDYQAKQIVELHDEISAAARLEGFESTSELIAFINEKLDADFSNQESYVKLKDIFPESDSLPAKAKFDCDSRAIMVSSILQNMGYTGDDAVMCEMEGHMIMYAKKDNVYFELTTNQAKNLSKDEEIQLNPIDTPEKYFSHLLSNEGTALGLEAEGSLFKGYVDKDKQEEAYKKISQAVELDSDNITAKLNLITLSSRVKSGTEKLRVVSNLHKEILASLVYRYHNAEIKNQESSFEIKKEGIKELPEIKQQELSLKDLSIEAVKESEYIRDKFEAYAEFSYFKADNYKEAASMYQLLLEALPESEKNSITAAMYERKIADSQFNDRAFDSYLENVDKTIEKIKSIQDETKFSPLSGDVEKLEAQKLVADILSHKIEITPENVADFIKSYSDHPVLGPVISGREHWNASYMDAVEMLRNWEGYSKLKDVIALGK